MQYKKRRFDDPRLIERMKVLAVERIRWGWRRLLIMIRRDGWTIGERAFRRIYRALGLHVMRTRKRHVRYVRGNEIAPAEKPNARWSMDFMHARLSFGRTYRLLNIVDDFTGEILAIEPAFSFGSTDVIRILENIAFERGMAETLRSDNGSEFCSHRMLRWAADQNIQLHFIQPGKPTQNAKVESLNGRIRDELLNPHVFRMLDEVRVAADFWRADYNDVRPHSTLGYLTPREFAERFQTTQPSQLSVA
jgi:putative transposase